MSWERSVLVSNQSHERYLILRGICSQRKVSVSDVVVLVVLLLLLLLLLLLFSLLLSLSLAKFNRHRVKALTLFSPGGAGHFLI